jgi:uncharacterized protein with PhoU and TrkA domain
VRALDLHQLGRDVDGAVQHVLRREVLANTVLALEHHILVLEHRVLALGPHGLRRVVDGAVQHVLQRAMHADTASSYAAELAGETSASPNDDRLA